MKTRYFFIAALALVTLLPACRELELNAYEDDPRLYFYRDVSASKQRDSISYSFFFQDDNVMRDTIYVEIRTMGFPAPVERPFRVAQSNAGRPAAAEAGVHFLSFDDSALQGFMRVAPGSISALVPVVLLRAPSLKTEKVRLEIEIVENDYFKPGIRENLKFLVKISDSAEKPASWSTWEYFFKAWGPRKMQFLTKYLGIDFNERAPQEWNQLLYYGGLAKEMLAQYNEEHPGAPLKEDDDTLVSFD
ncbi:MAG: DUF4843 domain-containing protein [Odoribacteraceae bacterium]|nr:DUF4843 domain-containing protein [Odoribacteraceae bacterium]